MVFFLNDHWSSHIMAHIMCLASLSAQHFLSRKYFVYTYQNIHLCNFLMSTCCGYIIKTFGKSSEKPFLSFCHLLGVHRPSVVSPLSVNISYFNFLLWNDWVKFEQTLVEWFLGSPLPKLCLMTQKMASRLRLEKRGDKIFKIFFSETSDSISTKLCWNDP